METDIHELTAGYALDALDPAEREAFEQHLDGCAKCQEDLAAFWEVSGALAVAAAGPEPSPELRDRILADARAEKQNRDPDRIAPTPHARARRRHGDRSGSCDRHRHLRDVSLAPTRRHASCARPAQEAAAAVLADPDCDNRRHGVRLRPRRRRR